MDQPSSATTFADLAAEVQIPQDGTLSRVLHNDERLRLVIFAFDEGQELTDHSAGVAAVIQVVTGRLEVDLAGDTTEIDARSWIHMPPRLPHAVRALEPSIMLLTMLKTG